MTAGVLFAFRRLLQVIFFLERIRLLPNDCFRVPKSLEACHGVHWCPFGSSLLSPCRSSRLDAEPQVLSNISTCSCACGPFIRYYSVDRIFCFRLLLCEKTEKNGKKTENLLSFHISVRVLDVHHHLPMLVHVNRCVMEFCWLLNGLPRCGYTCIFPHIVARRRVNVGFCIFAAEHQSKYFSFSRLPFGRLLLALFCRCTKMELLL